MPFHSLVYKKLTVRYILVYAMSQTAHYAAIQDITTCLNAGLQYHIGQRHTLNRIAEAHESWKASRLLVI